jgi:Sec-independent protein secretion pathway component TatC
MSNIYFYKHLNHLQNRFLLILLFFFTNSVICYTYSNECIWFLIQGLLGMDIVGYLIVTDITEIFFLQITISVTFSLFFSLWFILCQCTFFISSGCYKYENSKIHSWLLYYFLSFFFINYTIFNYLIPTTCAFFMGTEQLIPGNFLQQIFFEPKLHNFLLLMIKGGGFGNILLQYPFFVFNLLYLNIIRIKWLICYRKIFFLQIWVLVTLMSPPDILTPAVISFILVLFLEISIYFYTLMKNIQIL